MLRINPEQLESVEMKRILEYLIEKFDPSHPAMLQDYYIGDHDIKDRQMLDRTKPNNKLVINKCRFITDVLTGYFLGKPVSYTSDEPEPEKKTIVQKVKDKLTGKPKKGGDEFLNALTDIFEANSEQDHNYELGKGQSIQGVDYELLYLDEESNIGFANLARQSVIFVLKDDITGDPAIAVRIYDTDDVLEGKKHFYDAYTDSEIITFEAGGDNNLKSLKEIGRVPHYFGEVPVIAYMNNEEMLGDFEDIIPLNDALNKVQSDTANDFEYFTDAYLVATGAQLDDEDIATMRENRVIAIPDKEASVDWLIKDINDTAVENYKNRLEKDIHGISKTPNLSDEAFAGNLSGVAISYKLWPMEQISVIKERKFKKGLQRRLKLIANVLNLKGKSYDWRSINITFSRNIPQNMVEIVDMASKLKGIVSDETLLAQLPFVEDVQGEIEKLEAQKPTVDLDMFGGDEPEPPTEGQST